MTEKMLTIIVLISAGLFIAGWLVSIITMIWGFRLSTRLQEVDQVLWEKYHKYEFFGMQIYPANGYKMIPFYFNQEGCQDRLIKKYKKVCQSSVLVALVTIGISILMMIGVGWTLSMR